MEGSFADELYAETLQLSNVKLDPTSTTKSNNFELHDCDGDDLWHEDGSWNDSVEELDKSSDLDREWERRRDQFHTIGYRDGLMAGKEASAQEGFNVGFRESVFAGFNWGLVRGVTSALSCLPEGLKEKLVETQERKQKFEELNESAHSISKMDALKLFHNEMTSKLSKQSDLSDTHAPSADFSDQSTDCSQLEKHYQDLRSLILDSTALEVHLEIDC